MKTKISSYYDWVAMIYLWKHSVPNIVRIPFYDNSPLGLNILWVSLGVIMIPGMYIKTFMVKLGVSGIILNLFITLLN